MIWEGFASLSYFCHSLNSADTVRGVLAGPPKKGLDRLSCTYEGGRIHKIYTKSQSLR